VRGKPITTEQLRVAADLLLRGEPKAAVARAIGVSDRSLRRIAADTDGALARAVVAARARKEHAQFITDRRSAQRQGLPAPRHPREHRAETAAFHEALAVAQAPPAPVPPAPYSDAAILLWVLASAPDDEISYLDRRDAERAIISASARRRYAGQDPRRLRQIRVVAL
jgi:hypothetical protein